MLIQDQSDKGEFSDQFGPQDFREAEVCVFSHQTCTLSSRSRPMIISVALGGPRRAAGGAGGAGGRGNLRNQGRQMTAEELDAELDAYVKETK